MPKKTIITKCRISISNEGYEYREILRIIEDYRHDNKPSLEYEFRECISFLASHYGKVSNFYFEKIRVEDLEFKHGSLIIFFNLIIETITNAVVVAHFLDYCIEKLPYEDSLLSSLKKRGFNINIMFESLYNNNDDMKLYGVDDCETNKTNNCETNKTKNSKTIGTTIAILFSIIALFLSAYSVWLTYENSKTKQEIIKEEVKEEVKDALRDEKINILFNNMQRSNSDTETSTKK